MDENRNVDEENQPKETTRQRSVSFSKSTEFNDSQEEHDRKKFWLFVLQLQGLLKNKSKALKFYRLQVVFCLRSCKEI